jgi:phosphatidylinositol alpha-mannosyltransferase
VESGGFDVVHLHEPISPSVSMLALWAVEGPVVATFHTANLRSRVMQAAYPVLRPSLEKISGRIAVSEDARRTVTTHFGGDAVVIPNGVFVDAFRSATPRTQWQGSPGAPTMAFLGRIDEPRKGLPVLTDAMAAIVAAVPGVRLFIAGHGDEDAARARMSPEVAAACTFLGGVSDVDKASLLASVDLFIAPHTGGESFGIVLIEAMSAGCPVLASDLPAFLRVLEGGGGETFAVADSADLAVAAAGLLRDPVRRAALASVGARNVARFDWSVVGAEVTAVYETVVLGAHPVHANADPGSVWSRLLRTGRGGDGA